jgi:hypothetical protein
VVAKDRAANGVMRTVAAPLARKLRRVFGAIDTSSRSS